MSAVQPNILLHLFTVHSFWMEAKNDIPMGCSTVQTREHASQPDVIEAITRLGCHLITVPYVKVRPSEEQSPLQESFAAT